MTEGGIGSKLSHNGKKKKKKGGQAGRRDRKGKRG